MALLPWIAGCFVTLAGADNRDVVVEVSAGGHERSSTPVLVELPEALARARFLTLVREDTGQALPVQVVPGEPPRAAWVLDAPLTSGASRRYRLAEDLAPVEPTGARRGPELDQTIDDDGTTVFLDRHPVLTYHAQVVQPPAGMNSIYQRSGFIHPLATRSGRVLTEAFPVDHAHQHGLFFAWVNTTFEGRPVDFWNQATRTGQVGGHGPVTIGGGPVFREFRAQLRHDDRTAPGGPRPVLNESWLVRVYDVPGLVVVDFESTQICASDQPLNVNKYHYGGFGLRGTSHWFDATVKGEDPPDPARGGAADFLTSEGKRRGEGNHTRPRWVDLFGRLGGVFAGVAVLQHPANFRFPQPVRLHPNKPYFCFAPMVLGEFAIRPGERYMSRYRLVLHDGPPDAAALDLAWRDYAEPPVARVVLTGP